MRAEKISPQATKRELWDEGTVKLLEGGVALNNFEGAQTTLVKGNFLGRTAEGHPTLSKTVVVTQRATATVTPIRVRKNSGYVSGDYLSNGTLSVQGGAINTSNADYDTIAITGGFGAILEENDLLYVATSGSDLSPKVKPLVAVFADKEVRSGAIVDVVLAVQNVRMNAPEQFRASIPQFVFNPNFK